MNKILIILGVLGIAAVAGWVVCICIAKMYTKLKKQYDELQTHTAARTKIAESLTAIENALTVLNAAISQINTQLTGLAVLSQAFDQLREAVGKLDPGLSQGYTTLCEEISQLRKAIPKLSPRKRSTMPSKDKQQTQKTAAGCADASGQKKGA